MLCSNSPNSLLLVSSTHIPSLWLRRLTSSSALLSVVSTVLIIGYELQVQVLGVAASESNGQPAYPTYLLAPYRLATVAGGLFVAWIWTIFPYPVSEGSELRRDLGASLYMLANFSSLVHEIVQSRVRGVEGDINKKGTHAYNLQKARLTVFGKLLLLLNDMRTNSAFSRFQVRVGGKFPKEEYEGYACQQPDKLKLRNSVLTITILGSSNAFNAYSTTRH